MATEQECETIPTIQKEFRPKLSDGLMIVHNS